MDMLYARSFVLLSILAITSCKNNETEALHKEVMAIHDEIMPKTSEIGYLYLAFREKVSTDSTISDDQKIALSEQADDLEKAEDEMMVWMNDYVPPHIMETSKSKNQIINYLLEQKKIITNIKVHTNASLASGKKWKEKLSVNN